MPGNRDEADGDTSPARSALSVLGGVLLMMATGGVDAYVFLEHGHVFAQAMTGNLVLIAVGAVHPEIVAFWRPLLAFGSFVVGVLLARLWGSARQLGTLVVQIVVLVVVALLPRSFPDAAVIAMVACASGLQIASFSRIGSASFTTTVMTTNSMRTINETWRALASRAREDIAVARSSLLAFGGFVVGIFAGAGLSDLWGTRAAAALAALFVAVLIDSLVRRRPD